MLRICLIVGSVLSFCVIIACGGLLSSDYKYYRYECSNFTLVSYTITCFTYTCQYNKDQTFNKTCCGSADLNCNMIHQNMVDTTIYIPDRHLILGLRFLLAGMCLIFSGCFLTWIIMVCRERGEHRYALINN